MATSQHFVTLGELFARNSDEEDEELFAKVKIIIERSLPDGWRDWKAELFRKAVEPLRTSVCSRERISDALSSDVESHRNRIRNYSRSISHDENSQTRANMTRPIKRKRPRRQLSSSDENVNPSPARVCYYSTSPERSPPKRKCLSSSSSHSPKESSAETRLDRMEDMMQRLFEMMSSNKENENEPEISSWRAPSPLLVSPSENPPKEMVENWDIFSPSTKESEPAIPRANPILEEQGLKCQRLGETTWNKIRYSEAQKKLHASPVFNCLRVNATLQQYSYPSQIKDLLGKCDSAFGTITLGLLAQRLKLQEALKKVADQHPDAADTLKKALMAENEFRSLSDDLLQYSCGKRAEIIEYRRKHTVSRKSLPHLADQYLTTQEKITNGSNLGIPTIPRNHFKESRNLKDQNSNRDLKPKDHKHQRTKSTTASRRGVQVKDGDIFDYKYFRAGQLATHVAAWRNLGAPKSIISIIKGYVIPFSEKPPITPLSTKLRKKYETPASPKMDREITKMIQEQTLTKLTCKTGFLSKMFLTPKSDGKWRPVFNLKRLNNYVKLQKFRLINHRKLQFFLQKGDYMTKIDLSQAYYHVPIIERHWRYLALHYRNTTYALTALPFGLSSAPQIFAKITNWVAKFLRKQNIRLVVYLDDFLIWSWQQAKSILGKMEFASFVIPLARLHCRKIQRAVNHLPEFKPNAPFKIKTDVIQELKWWIANLDQNSNIIVKEPEIYLVTDASNTGWGAELKDRLISGLWTIPQRKWHINKKEIQNAVKIPKPTPGQKYPNTVRQQNSRGVSKESGWNQIHETSKIDRRHSRSSKTKKYGNTNRTYTRTLQCDIGSPIKGQEFARLAPVGLNSASHIQKMGHSMHRPICNTGICSSRKICYAVSMPAGGVCECIHKKVELQTRMDISSSTVDTQNLTTSQPMSGDFYFNNPQMGECLLATNAQEKSPRQTFHDTEFTRPSVGPSNESSPSQDTRFILGSMESTGWTDLVRNWSSKEKQVLETSWRKSSLGTYSAAWKSWCQWAKEKKVSLNNPNPTDVARYLCYLYHERKLSYGTICVHKTTIANFSNPLYVDRISNNLLIKHILKGISNSSPQAPRAKIWDINKLLAWLRHNPPDESNLFQVSRHLAILLLLSSGRRVHDLTLLRIDSGFIVQSENEVIFWPQYGSKTDKTKYIQSGWKLIKNKEQLWNIVYWIKLYIELSHQRRHPDGKIIPSLFVTTRGKTGPASRSVIAGWVRTALLSAGIEAGAGSTRSAVATFRFNNCVPLDELLKKGNWQGPDNFFKHYYKEIDKSPPCDDSNDKIMITESFVPL
ncbi:reverse transcriptase [Operophtera brumata]|uniref:Reverse transcriptase n=1 Tax=Operophtera brumata TaxID=104452 RepID=A0A0L7KRG6_OPEBR|nr:reverse transcriptase [Operophtera brumata]